MLSNGWKVTIGDLILGNPKKIVITKITTNCIKDRSKKWLEQIQVHKSLGSEIFLDYTDHHLRHESLLSNFYNACLQFIDKAIVPSLKMQTLLFNFYKGSVAVIEDPVEFFNQPIKLVNKPITLLWFGHASNINYLISFLKTGFQTGDEFRLIIISNESGLNFFRHTDKNSLAKIECQTGLWSPEIMLHAASKADACIIPADPFDPKKNGASSNRLITAFALGLPVATENLDSYAEFSNFYVDIKSDQFRNFLKDPGYYHDKIKLAQNIITPRFTMRKSEISWFKTLNHA